MKWQNVFHLKYDKFHLKISSSIVHKNDLFLDPKVHYLSKKQPKTYSLSNLCKIPDIFAYEIVNTRKLARGKPCPRSPGIMPGVDPRGQGVIPR